MKPQYVVIETILEADHWRNGKEFHLNGFRDSAAAKAEEMGLAIIGHEHLQYVWMVRSIEDGKEVYRSRNEDNNPTHIKVSYQRQAVSRKVRL